MRAATQHNGERAGEWIGKHKITDLGYTNETALVMETPSAVSDQYSHWRTAVVSNSIPASVQSKEVASFLYAIRSSSGMIKIGYANNPKTRLSRMQTGSPEQLELVYVVELANAKKALHLEQRLHTHFKSRRHRGEWFAVSLKELADVISPDDEVIRIFDPYATRSTNVFTTVSLPFSAIVFQRRSGRRGERASESTSVRPVCPWCGDPFDKIRSNQTFCCRGHSREACERRKEQAVQIMFRFFQSYGLSIEHIRDVAETCWNRLRALVESYGFRYDEFTRQWVFSLQAVVSLLSA